MEVDIFPSQIVIPNVWYDYRFSMILMYLKLKIETKPIDWNGSLIVFLPDPLGLNFKYNAFAKARQAA